MFLSVFQLLKCRLRFLKDKCCITGRKTKCPTIFLNRRVTLCFYLSSFFITDPRQANFLWKRVSEMTETLDLHKMKQWKSDLKCHKFIANIEYYWFYVLYKEVTSTIHFRVLYIFWKSFAYNTIFFEISSILLTWKLPKKKIGGKISGFKN